jgi:hypothetical protein
MEVEGPEHGIHSWRDFFVHMGTVCLGLIIALGLEQIVVSIHESHQRTELREALNADSRQDVVDAKRSEITSDQWIAWAVARSAQVRTALANNTALAARLAPHVSDMDIVDDPAFKAAKASGLLALLPQRDVLAYSEENGVIDFVTRTDDEARVSRRNVRAFELQYRTADGGFDFSKATPDELHHYLALLTDMTEIQIGFRFWNQVDRVLAMALLRGERDLNALHKVERTFNTPVAAQKL